MSTAIAWLGGGAFAASLGYLVYTYAVTLGRPVAAADGAAIPAAVVDTLLFSLFAAHHSLFARTWVKRVVVRLVPPSLERSSFVWVASLLLGVVCAAWQPLPGTIYAHDDPVVVVFHFALVAVGLILTALGARQLAPLKLAGIDQARHRTRGQPASLTTSFPYNLVRHPIYLGWVLAVFGVPRMTASRFLMACLSTAYLAMAIPWEERLLAREFGSAYGKYARRVRWRLIPWVY
jgi:methanethiol S-methyltransferase